MTESIKDSAVSVVDTVAVENEAIDPVVVSFTSTAAGRVTTPAGDEVLGHAVTDTSADGDEAIDNMDNMVEIGSKKSDYVFPFASVYLLPVEYLMALLVILSFILSVKACSKNCRSTPRNTFYAPVQDLPPPAV